jgi:hypothetical protein
MKFYLSIFFLMIVALKDLSAQQDSVTIDFYVRPAVKRSDRLFRFFNQFFLYYSCHNKTDHEVAIITPALYRDRNHKFTSNHFDVQWCPIGKDSCYDYKSESRYYCWNGSKYSNYCEAPQYTIIPANDSLEGRVFCLDLHNAKANVYVVYDTKIAVELDREILERQNQLYASVLSVRTYKQWKKRRSICEKLLIRDPVSHNFLDYGSALFSKSKEKILYQRDILNVQIEKNNKYIKWLTPLDKRQAIVVSPSH